MRKMLAVMFAVAVIFAGSTVAQADYWSWKGEMEGWANTWTGTQLEAGKFKSCESCGSSSYFMSAQQAGEVNLGLSGKEYNPDKVEGWGEAGYSTGYSQQRDIPGGSQEQWGSQYGNIGGYMKSR